MCFLHPWWAITKVGLSGSNFRPIDGILSALIMVSVVVSPFQDSACDKDRMTQLQLGLRTKGSTPSEEGTSGGLPHRTSLSALTVRLSDGGLGE